jgi:hypothetical protein
MAGNASTSAKVTIWVAVITTAGAILVAYLKSGPSTTLQTKTFQITGYVKDSQTQNNLSGASVTVVTASGPIKANTGDDGLYTMEIPADGSSVQAHFTVSAANYAPDDVDLAIVTSGDGLQPQFLLSPALKPTAGSAGGSGGPVPPPTPAPTPTLVSRTLGTTKFGTFEHGPDDLLTAFTIYTNDKDRCDISFRANLKLADGSPLDSVAFAKILEQNRARLTPSGYVSSAPSDQFRLLVMVTGPDVLFDPKQKLLCALSTIEIPVLE